MYITKGKKPTWKSYCKISTIGTFWKRQNSGDSEKISGCQTCQWGDAQSTEDFQVSEIILYDGIMFSSVQSLSCVQLYDPMDCSMPGFPVHHQLPEFTQTHVH